MRYRVEISTPAYLDAKDYFVYVKDKKESPEAAARWYLGLFDELKKLADFPKSLPLIPEQHHHRIEIRQFIYHSHRVIFSVDEQKEIVSVLRIYHGAREPLTPNDLK